MKKQGAVQLDQTSYASIIRDLTTRALWEVENVIACISDACWYKLYYSQPVWKHVYHMVHSLDRWFINPREFAEPSINEAGLNDLDVPSCKILTREDIRVYFYGTKMKIMDYLDRLRDDDLLICPENCEYTRFTLILAQHRHLHTHMGMLMGLIIGDTGKWPMVLGLTGTIPEGDTPKGEYEQ